MTTLTTSADGCIDDPPILNLSVGDHDKSHEIGIDGTSTFDVQFHSDGITPIQIQLRFTNDGLCKGPQGDVDKNIFVHDIFIRRQD